MIPSATRRLDVQGLRAVAVILVVSFHAGLPVPGGFTGVDVFLVISGFVITGMLMRELQRTGTIRFRAFYSRRIKRLLPALALLTTTVVVLSVFFGSPFGSQRITAATGLGATVFSANLVLMRLSGGYFSLKAWSNPLLHTWTLSVEEQVYLVFPSLLLGSWAIGRRLLRSSSRGAASMLFLVTALSFSLAILGTSGRLAIPFAAPGVNASVVFAFFSSVTRVWEFAIGAGLALASPTLSRIPARAAMLAGVLGVGTIGLGAFSLSGTTPYPGYAVLLPVLGAAAVIVAGFGPSAGITRLLETKPMTKIGDLSYAWYLWHWPLLVFAVILWPTSKWVLVVLGVLSLALAWLSTTFLEDPIRRNEAIKGRRVVALAVVCTLIPTVACAGLWAGAHVSWGSDEVAAMWAQVGANHVAGMNGCSNPSTPPAPPIGACEWNRGASGQPVYLIGDSTAEAMSEALIGASEDVGSPLIVHVGLGCNLVGLTWPKDGMGNNAVCGDYVASTVDWLVHQDPGIVVMSSLWNGIAGSRMAASLSDMTNELRGAGHKVVFVLPTPYFVDARGEQWFAATCPNVVALAGTAGCGATVSESQVSRDQSGAVRALMGVAEATGSTTLDLRSQFCWQGLCRTNSGNRWMFRDGIHITVSESEALAPTFADLIRQVASKE